MSTAMTAIAGKRFTLPKMHRARFVVVGSKPTVHRLFDILELTNTLPVVPSVEAAQAYLRGQSAR